MNDNDRLFNKIGVDIRMWRDNAYPPRITWIWILSITFSLLNAGVWIYIYIHTGGHPGGFSVLPSLLVCAFSLFCL